MDPVALEAARELLSGVDLRETVLDAVRDADAAVIVTEWPELRGLLSETREAMRQAVIVDGRNLLDPGTARAAGFILRHRACLVASLRAVRDSRAELELSR